MAYVDAIANAIGGRGNALAQGALQSGQVWGNLAANLGQIPGQAIAFHQQRQDALQNHELKKMALEKAQRNAEADKEAVRIVHSGAPDEQILTELERLYSGDPDKFIAIQNLKSQYLTRQQQVATQRYNILKGGPGVAPEGGFALPEPTQGVTQPGMGVANAFAPPVPVAQQMVNPEVDIPGIGRVRPPTHGQQELEKQQAAQAASDIMAKREKDVALYKQGIKPPPKEPSPSPYGDFASGDPARRKTAEDYLARNQDLEAENLRKTLMRLAIMDKQAGVADKSDIDQAAAAIVAHRMAPSQLTAFGRGKVRGQIMARVFELDPEFDVMKAEAGRTAGDRNQKIIRSLDAVEGGLDTVLKTSQAFDRSEIGLVNDIVLKGEVQLNNPKAIRFQTAVQSVIDDLASALSGGGATTDAARKQATTIFNSGYSRGGLEAAVGSVREILKARRDAFAAGTTYETKETGGGITVVAPNGKTYKFQTQADADKFKAAAGVK